ncbi:MAG: hypothetical protein IPH48_16730 [bacterium]|nr:hypothetical protein [bacterium]
MSRTPVQQYLINLTTAWAKGATSPVTPPPGLDAAALRAALLAHNVEVPLGALLPPELRDDRSTPRSLRRACARPTCCSSASASCRWSAATRNGRCC